MEERYNMCEHGIPDGMLHDRALYAVSLEDGALTLSFDIVLDEAEYGENAFAANYFKYKHCHLKCILEDEAFCDVRLETALNNENAGQFQYLSVREFAGLADAEIRRRSEQHLQPWTYLYTYTSPGIQQARIELCLGEMHYKGTAYTRCVLELEASALEYIWA